MRPEKGLFRVTDPVTSSGCRHALNVDREVPMSWPFLHALIVPLVHVF